MFDQKEEMSADQGCEGSSGGCARCDGRPGRSGAPARNLLVARRGGETVLA